jgi:type I restriction enzyme S subunit
MSDEVLWELPDSWQWTSIADLGDVVSGGTPSTKDPSYWNGEINWITPADLSDYNNKFIVRGAKSLTNEGLENSSAKLMPAGSVHFSSRAPIGYVVISQAEISTNQGFKSLIPAQGIFNEYIYYYLKSAKHIAEERAGGTTFKELSGKAFSQLPIPIAPSNEQYRIVNRIEEFFSELDKGIEYLRTAQEQLKVYRQSILKYAFEGKLTEEWREAHTDQLETADQLLEHIQQERENRYQRQLNEWEEAVKAWEENGKEDKKPGKPQMLLNISSLTEEELVNLPDLPETWCWIKLSVLSERIQIGPFGSLLHRSDYVSNQVPIVNPVHIRNQKIEPEWSLTVTEEKVKELFNYIMYPGDIVMGRRGEMGRCAVISHQESGFLCGSGSLFIRLLPRINPLFYCYLLGSQRLKNYLSDQSVGTTIQNLNQEIIHNLPVPLCSPIESQKITEEVDRKMTLITEIENTIKENLLASKILKQSILKKAFSGKLVPQNFGDENAAVLLERIREVRMHQEENQIPVPKPRKQVAMKKDLSIIEVLQELNGLATAQDVWRRSKHQEDIEGFYTELKKQINNGVIEEVKELREEKKSYLRLRNEN